MEINKLLTLVTSGCNMPMFDLDNNEGGTAVKENLVFTNLNNLFISIAPFDLVALDRLGNLHDVKKGEYIIKSNCRNLYFILDSTATLPTLISKVKELEEEQQKPKEEYPSARDIPQATCD